MNNNIITYVRIKSAETGAVCDRTSIQVQDKTYHANAVLEGPDQEPLFRSIRSCILEKCVQGYNCTVFAYGQTGSGKTYTIQGDGNVQGLVQRSLAYLHGIYPQLCVSFVEIYNENLIDLIEPTNALNIRDDPEGGITVDNLSIPASQTLEESLRLYELGHSNRKTTATQMNEKSSRSHSIFTILLEFKDRNIVKKSKLCFVDLAGSEKCRESEAERVKEACNINKSLLCLGKIVHKLSTNDKRHISYRDSKLTFLLRDSLGGNSLLAIIGNVNLSFPSDTLNTLQFLQRSKMISNHPSINYDTAHSSIEELTEKMKLLDEENQTLKNEVCMLRSTQEHSVTNNALFLVRKIRTEMEEMRQQCTALKGRLNRMVEGYFDDNRRLLLHISEAVGEINTQRKENLENINVKRRRVN